MISIKRPQSPPFLKDRKGKWRLETEEAIKHYGPGTATKAFEFKVYSDAALKEELKKVFKHKCAYCESSYGAVYDGDIEHFRPKGKVKEKQPSTPGDHWLANDWDNLLLSCEHCNQSRKHLLEGEQGPTPLGKKDQFPLSDETKRVGTHTLSLKEEERVRLLLNPCKDKPEKHFEYDIKKGVIKPLTDRGRTSVKIYALQRPLLVNERKNKLDDLLLQMERTKERLDEFNLSHSPAHRTKFETEFDRLNDFTAADKPYAGMCRFFVRRFIKDNGIR